MDTKELSKKMISYRAEKNLSQLDFADVCNLSPQTICNVENGKQNPSKITLQKILKTIGE